MTPRENLLAVLRHETPDYLPYTPLIGPYNVPASLPKALLKEKGNRFWKADIIRFLGGDIMDRSGGAVASVQRGDVETTSKKEGDYTVHVTKTPVGSVTSRRKSVVVDSSYAETPSQEDIVPVGPIHLSRIVERSIKTVSDYKVIQYIYENTEHQLQDNGIRQYIDYIGDGGVAMAIGSGTPIMRLILDYAGIERVVYDLQDHPKQVESLLEVMNQRFLEWYQAAASSYAQVIMCSDDADTRLISPKMFERYEATVLKKCAEICHRQGKVLIVHMCGHVRGFLHLIRDTDIDALDCLCPPSTGNTTMKMARDVWEDKITIIARIDPPVLVHGNPEEVSAIVREMLRQVIPGDNFILVVPCGRAPLENIQAAKDIVRQFGKYPVERVP
ncbi:uroporphyrinogen decarboxylase family protein [Candidatus Poribacteria bacterium]